MRLLIGFLPILLFVTLFVSSGIYFSYHGYQNGFYQLSPLTAIMPAIALGWLLHRGTTQERMHAFLDGVRHRDIITMCIIFLLAGAFSAVTKSIGSVDATVNLALSLVPPPLLLIGLFLTAAFISTAIGTSMGTIATIAPIAAGLSGEGAFSPALGAAVVIGGSMFGDNLSLISDTTIAAVMSQEADMRKKLILNAKIAFSAAIITMIILFFVTEQNLAIAAKPFVGYLVAPYLLLIALALCGVNVFIALVVSLVFAWIIGFLHHGYPILTFSQDINKGFASMQEIMLLSLMVGGLSGLAGHAVKDLATVLSAWIAKHGGVRMAQFTIAKIVSIFDVLLANNTIAIIFSGEIARDISRKHHVPKHVSAVWLDTFSCVTQGIIPYGAQILLASTIVGVSPLAITPQVYYCYVLAAVSIVIIAWNRRVTSE